MRRCCVVCVMLMLILAQAGCSSPEEAKTYPVSGEVTLDSKPLEGVTVMLQPVGGGSLGYGVTDANGLFVISTFAVGDGAIPGEHQIVVTSSSASGVSGGDSLVDDEAPSDNATEDSGSPSVPARYSRPESSGLKVIVEDGTEPLSLKLSSIE